MSEQYYSGDLALIHPKPSPQRHPQPSTDTSVLVTVEEDEWMKPPPTVKTFPEDLVRRFHAKEEKPLEAFVQKCRQSEVPHSILCVYATLQILFALIFYFSRDFLFLEYILYVFIMAPFVKIILTVYVNFQKSGGVCSSFFSNFTVTSSTLTETLKTNLQLLLQSIFPISWVRIFIVDNGSHRISSSIKLELCVAYFLLLQAYYVLLLVLPALKLDDWYSLASYYSALLSSMLILNHMVIHGKDYNVQIIDMMEAGIGLNLLYLVILPLRVMPSFYLVKETRYRRVPRITTLYFTVLFTVYHASTSFHLNYHYGVGGQVTSFLLPFLLLEFGWLPCTTSMEFKVVEVWKEVVYRKVYWSVLAVLALAYLLNVLVFPAVTLLFVVYLLVGVGCAAGMEGWRKTLQFVAVMFCIYLHSFFLYLADHHFQRIIPILYKLSGDP